MGRDVKEKNQGMDGTGSADPGTRMAAEERATEERTMDERTMENIIKDATDRYLDSFPEKEITVGDLEDMVSRHDRKVRKRAVRAAGIAALFVIVVAGIFFISGGYFDVGADKNPKEQIVKDDMVVSKDGGYGDNGGEDELVITEWDDILSFYKNQFQGLLVPTYVPQECIFRELIIQEEKESYMYTYTFVQKGENFEIHEYFYMGNLNTTATRNFDYKLKTKYGELYVKKQDGEMKASIQFESGVLVEIWCGDMEDSELIKVINSME